MINKTEYLQFCSELDALEKKAIGYHITETDFVTQFNDILNRASDSNIVIPVDNYYLANIRKWLSRANQVTTTSVNSDLFTSIVNSTPGFTEFSVETETHQEAIDSGEDYCGDPDCDECG